MQGCFLPSWHKIQLGAFTCALAYHGPPSLCSSAFAWQALLAAFRPGSARSDFHHTPSIGILKDITLESIGFPISKHKPAATGRWCAHSPLGSSPGRCWFGQITPFSPLWRNGSHKVQLSSAGTRTHRWTRHKTPSDLSQITWNSRYFYGCTMKTD